MYGTIIMEIRHLDFSMSPDNMSNVLSELVLLK